MEPPLGWRPCYPVRRRGKPTSASQPAPSAMKCQAGLRRGGRENRRNRSECAASSERRQRLTPRPYRVRARPWWEMRFSPGAGGRTAGRAGGERRASQEGDGVCLIFRPNAHVIRSASARFVLFRVAATVGATKGSRLGEVTRHRERRTDWTKTKKAEITQTERGGRERRISSQHGRSQRASGKRTRFLEAQEGIQ